MKYSGKMGSGAMTYIRSFKKIGSAIKKWIGGYIDTQREWRLHKPNFIFSK
jgi:hypothetical protein